MKRYKIARFSEIEPVNCPCGKARRAFVEPDNPVASVHIVQIERDAETHYHKKMTETYLVLEGEGHMELDGALHPVEPLSTILIKPGCRHRAIGDLRIANIPIPTFDAEDEWFD